jgi:protein phosphatase
MLRAHGVSHPGRTRRINEDTFLCEPEVGLFAVADGMGGHNAGEVASRLAVDAIRSFVARTQDTDEVTWPFGIDSARSFDANRLLTALKLANRRVFKASESRDEYTGMGTTVVVALAVEAGMTYAGVGDSRLYSCVDGVLTQLTRDDSWIATVGSMQDADATALARHPLRHVLTNSIGARESLDLEVVEQPLAAGEWLLLSSDGLHGALDHATIAGAIAGSADVQTAAERLVALALERDGGDNITAVVVRREP